MKRAGFTMIELIFVIVILGILSAVALPKFIGVSEQAQVGKFTAYAGTLSRTTLAPYWGEHLTDGTLGVLTDADLTQALSDLPMISGVTDATTGFKVTNLMAIATPQFVDATGPTKAMATLKIGTTTYQLGCSLGSSVAAPACNIYDATNKKWKMK